MGEDRAAEIAALAGRGVTSACKTPAVPAGARTYFFG
jgi:hypothetical protein